MCDIFQLLNRTEDTHVLQVPWQEPKSSTSDNATCSTVSSSCVSPTLYRRRFLPPSKRGIRREGLKRTLIVPSDLMTMKQGAAALRLGIPVSTFSKRWRDSLPDRKWPYRTYKKLESTRKILLTIQASGIDVTKELADIQSAQNENLQPAHVQIYEEPDNDNYRASNSGSSAR